MKILFLTWFGEETASSRTRVFQYLPHLRRADIDFSVVVYNFPPLTYVSNAIMSKRKPRLLWSLLFRPARWMDAWRKKWIAWNLPGRARRYDVLLVQKLILPPQAVNRLEKSGVKIAFDMDDAIYANRVTYDVPGLEEQMRILRLAVVENENTDAFFSARGIPTLRITGPIDCDRYRPAPRGKDAGTVTIGWIGSPSTSKNLKMIEGVLLEILNAFDNVRLDLVGANYSPAHPRARCVPWSLHGEVEAISRFDIGIMPLIDDEWARGKGGYKLLQYMALGIANVASPVGVNAEIVVEGETGLLARDDAEWKRSVTRLITEPALRETLGANARARAVERYSYQAATPALVAALSDLARP